MSVRRATRPRPRPPCPVAGARRRGCADAGASFGGAPAERGRARSAPPIDVTLVAEHGALAVTDGLAGSPVDGVVGMDGDRCARWRDGSTSQSRRGRLVDDVVPLVTDLHGRYVALGPSPGEVVPGTIAPGRTRRRSSCWRRAVRSTGHARRQRRPGGLLHGARDRPAPFVFLLEYLPAAAPTHYRVRVLDPVSGALSWPFNLRQKELSVDTEMAGISRDQVVAADRGLLFTLYRGHHAGEDASYAFVHVLGMGGGVWCLAVPAELDLAAVPGAVAVSPDESTLYVASANGSLATYEIDAVLDADRDPSASVVVHGLPAGGDRPALAVTDAGIVLAQGAGVVWLDDRLAPVAEVRLDATVSALGTTRDGDVVAAAGDRLVVLPAAGQPRRGGGDTAVRRREGEPDPARLASPVCPTPRCGPRCSRWRRWPPTASASRRRSTRRCAAADPYLTEIASHLVVAGGKRLRPVRRHRRRPGGRGAGVVRRRARRRGVRARAPRLALPRRRHRRGRHPSRRRDRQRQVGQPAGDPRRRLPAVAGVGDRRLARHRGRRAAGPHDRVALRGRDRAAPPHATTSRGPRTATSSSIQGKTASLYGTAARIGGIVAGLDRSTIDALTAWGNAFGMVFQIVDDILDITDTTEQLGKPAGHDLVEGVYTLPVLRTLAMDGGAGEELVALLGHAARDGRAGQGAGDRAGQRRRRERRRHRPPVRRRRRGGLRRPPAGVADRRPARRAGRPARVSDHPDAQPASRARQLERLGQTHPSGRAGARVSTPTLGVVRQLGARRTIAAAAL